MILQHQKKKSQMSERYWNSSRPKFVHGEPQTHIDAKTITEDLLRKKGYRLIFHEWQTPPLLYRGRLQIFPIDTKAYNRTANHSILLNFDGGYHYAGKYRGKTKNRDETIREYVEKRGYWYAVLDVSDVLCANEEWIWKQIQKQNIPV